ncbi:MAG: glycosyltransferase, partial [Candidatus Aenigmarchaeota archaeon]|nr:glycosyltransferase [Candidatus Aenigmarchaeota archaeon]
KKLATELNVQGSIIFYNGIDQKEMPALYGKTDVFVQAPRKDAIGMVLMEAMACGCPAVTTDAGSNGDWANFTVPIDDYEGMARDIIKILKDKKLADELSKKNINTAKEYFDTEKNMGMINKRFLELIKC